MSSPARPRRAKLTRLVLKSRLRSATTKPSIEQEESEAPGQADPPATARTLLWVGPEFDKILPNLEAHYRTRPLGESTAADSLILVRSDDPELIQMLCRAHPRAYVVVLVSHSCQTVDVVSILDAGADACLRDASWAELHAQLLAVLRRLDDKDRR